MEKSTVMIFAAFERAVALSTTILVPESKYNVVESGPGIK